MRCIYSEIPVTDSLRTVTTDPDLDETCSLYDTSECVGEETSDLYDNISSVSVQFCLWRGPNELFADHLTVCDFHLVKCAHVGCGEATQRRGLSQHMLQCPHRPVQCLVCQSDVPPVELEVDGL